MTAASNPHMISFSKKASESAAVAVLLVGGLALAGWFFGIEALKSGLPGLVAMNPVTALAFILSGASLGLLGLKQAGPWAGRQRANPTAVFCWILRRLSFGWVENQGF